MRQKCLRLTIVSFILLFGSNPNLPAQVSNQPANSSIPTGLDLPTILYGAAYYHEYEPYERLDKDVEPDERGGAECRSHGRIHMEPVGAGGRTFEYAWMDRVVDAMGKAGIKVILGTPTYSIPTWLYHEHPEILARPARRSSRPFMACARTWTFPIRRIRQYCERVIRSISSSTTSDNPVRHRLAAR